MIANFASMDVKPGSMGRPLPGIEAAIVQRTSTAASTPIDQPMVEGELALKAGWPSMFRGYLHERSAIASASSARGTSPATSRGAMPMATTGSSAAPTT